MKLKYIKRMFEQSGQVSIVSIDKDDVTLISPDGDQETVTFEEDGSWEDWIDPPWVKHVSVSADGDRYRYYAVASTDDIGTYLEIDENSTIEWESLDLIKKKNDERIKSEEEARLRREKEARLELEREEREIAERGITRFDYELEKEIERMKDVANLNNIPQDSRLDDYAFAVASQIDREYDMWLNYFYKIPLHGMSFEEFESTLNMFKDLGMEEAMAGTFKGIPTHLTVTKIIKKDSDEPLPVYLLPSRDNSSPISLKQAEEYLNLAPFGVALNFLFKLIHEYRKNTDN
jgi:hypothetical protein